MTSSPFTLLHPIHADLDRVFQFMLACDVAEYGEPDSDLGDLTDAWKEADLCEDAWIAQDPAGELCGYTLLTRAGCTLDFYINLGTNLPGLAESLLDLGVARFKNLITSSEIEPDGKLTIYANGRNAAMCKIIESRDFLPKKFHYRMQIDFGAPVPAPDWPAEYVLSTFREADEKDLYALIDEAFDWPGHEMPPFETWKKYVLRGGRFDPEFFILVRRDGKLVGAALTYNEEPRGWLKQLAVAKAMQGKGLGSLLLRHVFSLCSQHGLPGVALGVASTNSRACEFYERSGMHRTREFVEFHWKMTDQRQSVLAG